ncbi:hypothetical protein DL767_004958 [Monosporascus sp. MG133]|nr:hypothetical protein DL767_004958 [Monosporascus sp. MG133]
MTLDTLMSLLSWQNFALMVAIYFASLSIYRLFFHPLAQFPGPWLAAVTRYYEAYYDIVQNGQYTFKIAELHKKYGPIIRISPYELHVMDPAYFEKLYRHDGRWDKYAWAYDAFPAKGAIICTVDHYVHKARRAPLNPLFSKAKVAGRQDLIRRHVETFCDKISEFAASGKSMNLGTATTAFTKNVATEFILDKSFNNLDQDFTATFKPPGKGSGYIWRVTKHIRWFEPTMRKLPTNWVIKNADAGASDHFKYLKQSMQDTKDLMTAAASSKASGDETPRTIVHAIVNSNLPAEEKEFGRVWPDVATVAGAGVDTTASVLRLIFYHVFSDAGILKTLRAELASANIQSSSLDTVELRTLEQLPYLTGVLMEGLRLSPAIASRMARIAPDRDLYYGERRIPARTPIGMTILLIHTNESLYPEPKRFHPDRWTDLEARKKAEKTFAPFSRGTRNCLGMYLAWAEMYHVVAAVVQRFDFQFEGASAKDFECESDQFAIRTYGGGILNTRVSLRQ